MRGKQERAAIEQVEHDLGRRIARGGIAAAVIALNGCDFTTSLAVIGACAVCKVLYDLLPFLDRGCRL